MAAMPQSKEALQRMLRITKDQLAPIEARLTGSLSEAELNELLEKATDLQMKIAELYDLLTDAN